MQRRSRLEIESGGVWVRVPIKTVCLSVCLVFLNGALGALGVRFAASCTPAALLRSAAKAGGRRDRVERDTVVWLALCLCSPRSIPTGGYLVPACLGMGSSV